MVLFIIVKDAYESKIINKIPLMEQYAFVKHSENNNIQELISIDGFYDKYYVLTIIEDKLYKLSLNKSVLSDDEFKKLLSDVKKDNLDF